MLVNRAFSTFRPIVPELASFLLARLLVAAIAKKNAINDNLINK
jgi:hypothetical protein